MSHSHEELRKEFKQWITENYGHGGNPGTDEMDNDITDYWLQKFTEREQELKQKIEAMKRWTFTTSHGLEVTDDGTVVPRKREDARFFKEEDVLSLSSH